MVIIYVVIVITFSVGSAGFTINWKRNYLFNITYVARGLRLTLKCPLFELIAISFSEIRIIQRALNKWSTIFGRILNFVLKSFPFLTDIPWKQWQKQHRLPPLAAAHPRPFHQNCSDHVAQAYFYESRFLRTPSRYKVQFFFLGSKGPLRDG